MLGPYLWLRDDLRGFLRVLKNHNSSIILLCSKNCSFHKLCLKVVIYLGTLIKGKDYMWSDEVTAT